jgi:hypothetical protein
VQGGDGMLRLYKKAASLALQNRAIHWFLDFVASKLANLKQVLYFTLAWSDLFLLLLLVTVKSVDDAIQDLIELKERFNPVLLFL